MLFFFPHLGFLKTNESVPLLHWNWNTPMCLVWLISSYFSIRYFLSLLPLNSCSWSYVIYVCHVIVNKFSIDIACLSLYCVSLMALRVKVLSFPIFDNVGGFMIYIIYYLYKMFVPWYFFSYLSW